MRSSIAGQWRDRRGAGCGGESRGDGKTVAATDPVDDGYALDGSYRLFGLGETRRYRLMGRREAALEDRARAVAPRVAESPMRWPSMRWLERPGRTGEAPPSGSAGSRQSVPKVATSGGMS